MYENPRNPGTDHIYGYQPALFLCVFTVAHQMWSHSSWMERDSPEGKQDLFSMKGGCLLKGRAGTEHWQKSFQCIPGLHQLLTALAIGRLEEKINRKMSWGTGIQGRTREQKDLSSNLKSWELVCNSSKWQSLVWKNGGWANNNNNNKDTLDSFGILSPKSCRSKFLIQPSKPL